MLNVRCACECQWSKTDFLLILVSRSVHFLLFFFSSSLFFLNSIRFHGQLCNIQAKFEMKWWMSICRIVKKMASMQNQFEIDFVNNNEMKNSRSSIVHRWVFVCVCVCVCVILCSQFDQSKLFAEKCTGFWARSVKKISVKSVCVVPIKMYRLRLRLRQQLRLPLATDTPCRHEIQRRTEEITTFNVLSLAVCEH